MLKSNTPDLQAGDWRPACSMEMLRMRAQALSKIRQFFLERSVLEVETPILCQAITTDPNLLPFRVSSLSEQQGFFLQPSPEFAMKRLLASGIGPIYQICKAFRQGERGRLHNPEFTMIEWYRPGFTLRQLMQEVAELVMQFVPLEANNFTNKISYQAAFQEYVGIDPLNSSIVELQKCAEQLEIADQFLSQDLSFDFWLDLIFSHAVQPNLGKNSLCFVTQFPASQAALAKINHSDPRVAERFELYWQGMELANAFDELDDANEQRRRFEAEQAVLKLEGQSRPLDEKLLQALEAGLPSCSGVALGFDRLMMAAASGNSLSEVLAFPSERA